MNILEDYISWAWDVTKGKQSWQPKVTIPEMDILNAFQNDNKLAYWSSLCRQKSLNDDQVYLDETAPDNIVKTLLSNGDVATRLIPYKPRKLALTAPFAQSCRGWMIISTNQRDECSLGLHNCNENAQCIDTPHAFQCTCNTGYSGNGIDVMETNEELKKQIGCVPDVTTTSSTTTTTTTSTTTTSTTTTTTSTTTTTTTSTTTTTTITTTSTSTTTTTTTTTSTTPEIYYEDESQWNFNDMANDFNSNFDHEEVEEEEEEQEYEEHEGNHYRRSNFNQQLTIENHDAAINETLQLDTAEESSLLSAEQVKVARVTESDDYARMKGISRICRAVECLQNLRNFVAKR